MNMLFRGDIIKSIGIAMLIVSFSTCAVAQNQDSATAVDGPCANKFGDDKEQAQKNLSMFNQYYQTKEYHKAYKYYRYLLVHAPCVNQRLLYSGNVIVESKMTQLGTTDMEAYRSRFNGLRDTLYMSFEKRIEIWGQEGYVKGKWANAISYYDEGRISDALAMFKESVDLEGNNTDSNVPSWYILAAIKAAKKEVIDLDSLYSIYFKMMDIIMYNKAKGGKWIGTENYVNQAMAPYFDCGKLEEYFKPLITANPDDIELKKSAVQLMGIAKCESLDFYLQVAEDVIITEPSAEAFLSLAQGNLAKGNRIKAKELYRKGLSMMEEGGPEKVEIMVILMTLNYGDKEYSKARSLANKILALDQDNGHAFIILSSVYGSMSSSCKDDGLEGKSIYWVAYDMASKALNSEETAEDAQKLMAHHRSHFITIEDAFQHNFTEEEGSAFRVNCVGASTTVRYRSE